MVAACHKLFGFPKQCFRGFTCCALCKRQKLGGGLGTRLCLHSNKTKMYRHIIFKSIYLRSLLWALWITLPICIYVTDHCLHSRLEQQTGTSFIPRPLLQRQVRTTKHYSLIPRPLLQRQVRTTKHYSLIPRPLLQRQVRTTKHYSLIPRPLLQRQVRTTKHYSLIPRPLLQRQVVLQSTIVSFPGHCSKDRYVLQSTIVSFPGHCSKSHSIKPGIKRAEV